MNVTTLAIPEAIIEEKIEEYNRIPQRYRTQDDYGLERVFKAARQYKLIDIVKTFTKIMPNERGEPRLALARAYWEEVHCKSHKFIGYKWADDDIELPINIGPKDRILETTVPYIPAEIRPKKLSDYHILFEVKNWKSYSADPFLLRHIYGWIFAIVAEWELTALEQQILDSFHK